ncbi:MAG: hypothetical protein SV760_00085 [Halobacteria archaeon]|nr:hypothetical protein [Halobacteria archaeon]
MGTASAAETISVGVEEQGKRIIVEVTRGTEPLSNANVTVQGVGNSTPLDGTYVTGSDGTVVFGEKKTSNLSGVIHLRIGVETNRSYKSVLTTITRTPDLSESAPLGQRISMSLQDTAAGTRGAVEGNIFVTRVESIDSDENKIEVLAEHAENTLENLSRAKFERQVLGRRFATGKISLSEFYTQILENSGRVKSLRSDLRATLERLGRFSDQQLRQSDVDPDAVDSLLRTLRNRGNVDTDTSLFVG